MGFNCARNASGDAVLGGPNLNQALNGPCPSLEFDRLVMGHCQVGRSSTRSAEERAPIIIEVLEDGWNIESANRYRLQPATPIDRAGRGQDHQFASVEQHASCISVCCLSAFQLG